jgi:four helix bundle protein
MGDIKDHRDLEAWQVAMDAVMKTYDVTADFPSNEVYGLASQMQRAAVSGPSNIAEGQAKFGRAGLNHLTIALGSFAELDTQLEIARRRTYVGGNRAADLQRLIDSSRRLLHGLRRARRKRLGLSVAAPSLLILAIRLFV